MEGLRPTKLPSGNVPAVVCAWAPSWAAGGTVTPHLHLYLISCYIIHSVCLM